MTTRCRQFINYLSKAQHQKTSTSTFGSIASRKVRIAGIVAGQDDHRYFATSSSLHSGALADICNVHVISSPYTPIIDSSTLAPVPNFVSSVWTDVGIADKVAVRDGSTGETRTFSDYRIRMQRIASALQLEYQLKPNETVSIFSPNHVDYLPICLAVGMCGAKISPINPLYTATELSKILVPSHTKILFAHSKLLPIAMEAVRSNAPCVKHVIVLPDVQSDTNIPEGMEHLDRLTTYYVSSSLHEENTTTAPLEEGAIFHNANQPFLLPYSSGTTGQSKGVMLSHANSIANLLQLDEIERNGFPQEHKLISPLPFFHIYGLLVSLIYCGWRGQELITMSDRFDLERFCQIVQEHRPERAHLVPPIILGLAKHPVVDNHNMDSLKTIVSAAAPLGKDTEDAVKARLNLDIKQAWGMSELSPIATMNPESNPRSGSVGPLVSSTHGKIIDTETGRSLGPNEQGELCIKGPQVMMGYFNDDEKTNECLSDGGWLRTGDLAYYDPDGFFYITDRLKELIKVRGFQVAPAELEELLLQNDLVQDVAVVQIPDDTSGELPRAYIVLKSSAILSEETKGYLMEWVKERVSPHKRINGGVVFVDQIPKSASGKILRRILRDEAKKEIETSRSLK